MRDSAEPERGPFDPGVRRPSNRAWKGGRDPFAAAPPRRILIIKPSAIGDVVHALPVLALLRRRWPAAHVAWLVTPACAGLIDGHPQLDEVIRFDRKRFGHAWRNPAAAAALATFHRDLRRQDFDLVIDLQGLFRSGWLGFSTGAKVRVGTSTDREFGWAFHTHVAPVGGRDRHAVDRYLAVADFLGLGTGPVEFVFPTDDADRAAVAPLLPAGPFAVLVPGTNWPTKQWPAERLGEMVGPLRDRFGLASVVAGAAGSATIPGAVDLAGRTTLRQLVAVLERASLVVAPDTGPMHIAAALGRPLVTVFGPTDPGRTGPYGRPDSVVRLDIPCSPCLSRRCVHHTCLRSLGIGPILAAAAAELGRAGTAMGSNFERQARRAALRVLVGVRSAALRACR
jgi:heptosyltransferase-1